MGAMISPLLVNQGLAQGVKLFPQAQLMVLPVPLHPIKNLVQDKEASATLLFGAQGTAIHAVFGRWRRGGVIHCPLINYYPTPRPAIVCILH